MKDKPIIGITSSYVNHSKHMEGVYVHHDYHRAVIEAGGIPVILPIAPPAVLDTYISMCDGFIMSGGEDVDPKFYYQDPHQKLGVFYTERDESELYLIRKIVEYDKPLLGICRGMQLLNVAMGGTLIQDLPSQKKDSIQHVQTIGRHKLSHEVHVMEASKLSDMIGAYDFMVNSIHHQAIDVLSSQLRVGAISSDRVIEAVEHPHAKFVIGVQWHPESLFTNSEESKILFAKLMESSL